MEKYIVDVFSDNGVWEGSFHEGFATMREVEIAIVEDFQKHGYATYWVSDSERFIAKYEKDLLKKVDLDFLKKI